MSLSMLRQSRKPEVQSGFHGGIWYSLENTAGDDVWRYSLMIDGKPVAGQVHAKLPLLAIRLVKMRIDRVLRPGRHQAATDARD